MSASESRSGVVLALAEEFLERYRQGQRPSLKEYIDRHPELAAEIKEVFPALALMENVALADESLAGAETPSEGRQAPESLQQLGDYRIIREVGRGGMGIVYEAEQVSLGRHVALKVLPRKMLLDATQKRRFEREAKAAAKLHHTNIVPVFGVGEQDGLPYYVMQFIQGLGLDLVLKELKRLKGSGGNMGQVASLPLSGRQEGHRAYRDISSADLARSLMTGEFHPVEEPSPGRDETIDEPAGAANQEPASASGPLSGSVPTLAVSPGSITLPGQSGDKHKSKTKKQTYWQSVAQIGVQVADALEYAHKQGILHRDIKPSNLLLDTQGTVWVTDFGLAKADDQQNLTDTGDILGTLRYMPPEAFEGKSDARSDVYSLGLTLYEMLALRPAFDEKERNRLIKQVTHEEPPRLGKLNRSLPRDLETIVLKAIARDPACRYQTATELAEDLRHFLAGEPIGARRTRSWERMAKWAKRRPAAAALMGVSALFALALSALAVGLWYNDQLQRALDEAKEQRAEADRQRRQVAEIERNVRYLRDLQLTEQAWQDAHVEHTLRVLDRWRPAPGEQDLRGWEWYYLRGLCHKDFRTLKGSKVLFDSIAFHPDGRRLAVGDWENKVHVWDVLDGRKLHTLTGHQGWVRGLAFSPDGRHLASAGEDHTVRIWDVASGQETGRLQGPEGIRSVAFSPDGRYLASAGTNGSMALWDSTTHQELHRFRGHQAHIHCVTFSPDGRYLASAAEDRTAKLWDVAGGPALRTFRGHTQQVSHVAFSPDGQTLATSSEDRTIKLWDPVTGRERASLAGHTAWVYRVAFSPDGRLLASASDDMTVRLWDVVRRQQVQVLRGHQGTCVRGVAFSPDGRLLASAGFPGTVKVWDRASGPQEYRVLHHSHLPVRGLAFAPDGRRLAAVGFNQPVGLWDVPSGRRLRLFTGHAGWGTCVAFRADGKLLASGGSDGMVRLWDPESGQALRTLAGHAGWVNGLSFSPDGWLASAGGDKTLIVWNVATGQKEHTLQSQEGSDSGASAVFSSAAFSPDGRWLAAAGADKVQIWETQTWQVLRTLPGVGTLAISPDGRWLVAGCANGGHSSLKLWDVASGELLREFQGHWSSVYSVAFSPDGRRLASAGTDRKVKIWDTASGQLLLSLREHSMLVYAVAFSPDGRWLASADAGGEIRLWDASPDGSAEAEDRASVLAPERTLAWHLAEAEDSLKAGQRAAALWHLNRLAETPLTDPFLYVRLGNLRAEFGLWQQAAADYGKAVHCGPIPLRDWERYALVCLEAGDLAAYRRLCATLQKRLGDPTRNLASAHFLAWMCALGPDAVADYKPLLACSEQFLARLRLEDREQRHAVLNTLGALLYRSGRDAEALERLNEALAVGQGQGMAVDWVFLAMAHHRLGHAAEARKWFDQVPVPQPRNEDRLSWDHLKVQLLRREAEALLAGKKAEPKK